MEKIGIFYAPNKGSVAKVAQIIEDEIGNKTASLHPISSTKAEDIDKYNYIIFGISTVGRNNWDSEHKDNDWDLFYSQFNKINWTNKKVAIYGLGDHINYPDNFVDAIGWLKEKLDTYKATIVGQCEAQEYQFNDSAALDGLFFVGLPLDEDNEPEKTLPRIKNWLKKLHQEFTD